MTRAALERKHIPLPTKQWERLQPFLFLKEARQRVILYLIACGYSVGDLINMTIPEIRGLHMHPEIEVARDEMLDGVKGPLAFVFPTTGKPVTRPTFYRALRLAAKSATGRVMSQEQFREYLRERK
jgi:hypothetical protein